MIEILATKIQSSASLSASPPLKSRASQDKSISESDKSRRRPFLGRFFVNFGLIS